MKRLNTFFLALTCLLLSSCIEDNMAKSAMGKGMVPISLTISPSAASTRTTSTDDQTTQLASGQAFYAYFTSSDVTPQSTTFTADGSGATTPATQPYFKLSETTTDVRAYYPSSVTEGTTQFSVQADQSADAGYRASDLMFASATIPKAYPTSNAALTFAHKMAKIRVNTTTRASSIKAIKLTGILPTVPFTASSGVIGAAEGSATDVILFSSSGTTSDISCVALVPPQSFAADATLIEIVTGVHGAGDPLVYKLPAAIAFAGGNQYIFNVDLHEEQLTVTYTVAAWGAGATNAASVDFKNNRPKLPIEYVAPYNMQTQTSMALDNLMVNSGYFSWNESTAKSGGVGTPSDWSKAKENIQAMIKGTAVAGYHLPSKAEWCSVVAPYNGSSNDSDMSGDNGERIKYMNGQHTNLSETVAWGVTNNNGTYSYDVNQVFYNDYNCPNDAAHTYIGYGLRFKELSGGNYVNGQYTCAYRYEYKSADASVGGGASLTIKVIYVGANPAITISTISDEDWWSSPEYTLVLPACGYSHYSNGCDRVAGWSSEWPAYGYYWSATARNENGARDMSFWPSYVNGNRSDQPGSGFSVRLFMDEGTTLQSVPDEIGKVLGANGQLYNNVSAATSAGTTASGIVAYVGSPGSVDESNSTYKWLVISLTDIDGHRAKWKNDNTGTCVNQTDDLDTALGYLNGITCTNTLVTDGHTHAAATAARNYSTTRPSGASSWFLPSLGQWQLIMQGLASKKAGFIINNQLSQGWTSFTVSNLNSLITDAGGTGFEEFSYWVSTEYSSSQMWRHYLGNGAIAPWDKNGVLTVRPVFAY